MGSKTTWLMLGGLAAVVALAPMIGLYPVMVMKVMCFALFACAFNLLIGFAGLLSFGHAMFLGTAGYVAGHAMKVWGMTPELGLLAGTATAAMLGYIVGSLAIRRQGIYFSMITLALSQLVFFVLLQSSFTGGEDGLQGVPRGKLFGLISLADDMTMYVVVACVFLASFAAIHRIVNSPFGQILKAIRENEPRAISLGYDAAKFKLLAFVLSAGFAGLAGATKTLVLGFETLTDAHWHASGEVVLMTLLGGMGTLLGPVVGATTIVAMQTELSDKVGSWVTVIMGITFVVCVLLFRKGIVGEAIAWYQRRAPAQRAPVGGQSPASARAESSNP